MTNTITTNRADRIIKHHDKAMAQAQGAVDSAIEAGRLLAEQKGELDHGEWLLWIKANLPFKDRQARNYMRVYRSRAVLLNRQSNADLTLTEAVNILSTPKPQPDAVEPDNPPMPEDNVYELIKEMNALGERISDGQSCLEHTQSAAIKRGFIDAQEGLKNVLNQASTTPRQPTKKPSDIDLVESEFTELEQMLVKVDQKGRALSREMALFLAKAREMNATQVRSLQSFFISTTFMEMLPDCYKLMELFGIDTSRQDNE